MRKRAPLPLQSLSHLSRVVQDTQVSAAFYTEVLGFTEIRRPSSFEFEGCWLIGYGISLHLIKGTPVRQPRPINPSDDHTSFQACSLDEVERRLSDFNIPYVMAKVEEHGVVVSQIFFHDPDNNMIEVCNCDNLPKELLSESRQLSRACTMPLEALQACKPSLDLGSHMHFDAPSVLRPLR
ncbi:hypothetical protein COCOBI_09-3150 [Coccomyxa sp. Obi]|nr:hypothetical protein COCOBI_09-3150 [Coccomyxa sp. Obi]